MIKRAGVRQVFGNHDALLSGSTRTASRWALLPKKVVRSMTASSAPPLLRAGAAAADAPDAAPTVDVGELALVARKRLRLLPYCLAIALAIALAYIVLTPSRYAATMSILVDPRERPPSASTLSQCRRTPTLRWSKARCAFSSPGRCCAASPRRRTSAADPEFRPGALASCLRGADEPAARRQRPTPTPDSTLWSKRSASASRSSATSATISSTSKCAPPHPMKAERWQRGLAEAFFAEQGALGDDIVAKQSRALDTRVEDLRNQVDTAERRAQNTAKPTRSSSATDKFLVGGYLKVAPEHTDRDTLALMKKPGVEDFVEFDREFKRASAAAGKKQYLIPYFISSHPGSGLDAMIDLALFLKRNHYKPDQVQDFIPSPFDIAACMYHTGHDPFTAKAGDDRGAPPPSKTATGADAVLQPENYFEVRRALEQAGRQDLIGSGCDC